MHSCNKKAGQTTDQRKNPSAPSERKGDGFCKDGYIYEERNCGPGCCQTICRDGRDLKNDNYYDQPFDSYLIKTKEQQEGYFAYIGEDTSVEIGGISVDYAIVLDSLG